MYVILAANGHEPKHFPKPLRMVETFIQIHHFLQATYSLMRNDEGNK